MDLSGKNQHGFKKKHGTSSLSLTLQSIIARALEEDDFAIMAYITFMNVKDFSGVFNKPQPQKYV